MTKKIFRQRRTSLWLANFKAGFTLIELLIAVAIIGVLSALLTANFIGIRQRARDAQRKADLRQMQSALELYRADEGSYPPAVAGSSVFPANCSSSSFGNAPTCTSIYMQKIPSEPLGTTLPYTYSRPSQTTYSLVACLENGNDPEIDKDTTGTKINCTGSRLTRWKFILNNP